MVGVVVSCGVSVVSVFWCLKLLLICVVDFS